MLKPAHRTRVFLAGAFAFSVASNQSRLCKVVERLFADLATAPGPGAEFTLTDESAGTRFHGPDVVEFTYRRDTSAVLDELVTAVNRLMLDAGEGRLHLHAGAVASPDGAVLISAASGVGKTTLVATLASRGWTYLTDEAVSIDRGDVSIRSFPKPLSVKPTGHMFLSELADHRVVLGGHESGVWHVPVGELGAAVVTSAQPRTIVVLTRDANEPHVSWRPLSPADAVVELVEQSLDFGRYGPEALLTVAELCARCRCVAVGAGTPAETAALVEDLAGDYDTTVPIVMQLPVRGGVIRAVAIGTEAVLQNITTGKILSLNQVGLEVWQAIEAGDIDSAAPGPANATFVHQLASAGFLDFGPGGIKGR